jgi:DNA invertase Pin-like site-specific DNA recombinase
VAHPDLVELPRRLDPVDVLILKRLDRLARSTRDLRNLLRVVAAQAKARFRSIRNPYVDTTKEWSGS